MAIAIKQKRDNKGRYLPKHGLYVEAKDRRYVDRRFLPARIINGIMKGLEEEGGGVQCLSASQQAMLANIRITLTILLQLCDHISQLESIIEDNELCHIAGQPLRHYQNDLTKFLTIYRDTIEKNPKNSADINSYLKNITSGAKK